MKKAILLLASLTLFGCASVKHSRDHIVDGKVVGREVEEAHAFLYKGAIEKLSTRTKDGDYTHSVSANGVQGAGDAETIKALADGFSQVAGSVAAAAIKKTVTP